MTAKPENPYATLKSVFHEPNRLAIVSALSSADEGLTFTDLKIECDLTDGNLSRHLKMLEEADIVSIRKEFVGSRPRTTVFLTDAGREGFLDYLMALEEVLRLAGHAIEGSQQATPEVGVWKAAQA